MGDTKYVSKVPKLVKEKEQQDNTTYTHEEIGSIVGVSRQAVSRWYSNKPFEMLNLKTVAAFSQWLGVSWDQLFEHHQNGNH